MAASRHAVADCKNGPSASCLPVSVLLGNVTLQIFFPSQVECIAPPFEPGNIVSSVKCSLSHSMLLMEPSLVSLQGDESSVAQSMPLSQPPHPEAPSHLVGHLRKPSPDQQLLGRAQPKLLTTEIRKGYGLKPLKFWAVCYAAKSN